ncbi:hypothetical protein K501DRAFT_92399 [Backusella circina FSU 941]|nr:hypothetical protein K501DRAFT_92399 [Backusella circina FSU 941]
MSTNNKNTERALPKSLSELNELATIHIDECIPIEIYIHSADLLIRQARIYNKEGNEEQAYVFYLKYINLVLKELDHRPEFIGFKNKVMMEECVEALDELEILKPSLLAVHESYQSYQREERLRNKEMVEPSAPDEKYEGLLLRNINNKKGFFLIIVK